MSLMVSDTQTVCERVLDDELELGVVGAARPSGGSSSSFLRDELVVIVPPGHHLAAQPP